MCPPLILLDTLHAGGSFKANVAGWMARTLSPWRSGSRGASPGHCMVFLTPPGRSPRPAPKLTPLAGDEPPAPLRFLALIPA